MWKLLGLVTLLASVSSFVPLRTSPFTTVLNSDFDRSWIDSNAREQLAELRREGEKRLDDKINELRQELEKEMPGVEKKNYLEGLNMEDFTNWTRDDENEGIHSTKPP